MNGGKLTFDILVRNCDSESAMQMLKDFERMAATPRTTDQINIEMRFQAAMIAAQDTACMTKH